MYTACTPLLQQIQPTNPWAQPCPQPTSFTVNDFLLKNNTISLKVTYDSDAGIDLICPNRAQDYYESYSDGAWDLSCDVDGLARVITDGKGWVWVGQNHFCDYFTGCKGRTATSSRGPSTVAIQGNFTTLASELTCVEDTDGTQTCTLTNPEFKIPVTGYSEGPWILGYGAMALDGTYLPDCGERRPPWVEDPETCDETK
ncbi:hypothetical protein IFR04_006987 [Cadophora malorum]|uniref:Uncharacterized protein n=1 Tax=Cadophora malorum TaxID=108018 RepID=A0A8H7TIM8_9HELO|nr:hypothetical protein IFR04_006987 [Cadophora malorum]